MVIRDLLGHKSIKTTQRYIQMNKKEFKNLANPLDELYDNDNDHKKLKAKS
jgi:site-specific recombinase XerC